MALFVAFATGAQISTEVSTRAGAHAKRRTLAVSSLMRKEEPDHDPHGSDSHGSDSDAHGSDSHGSEASDGDSGDAVAPGELKTNETEVPVNGTCCYRVGGMAEGLPACCLEILPGTRDADDCFA